MNIQFMDEHSQGIFSNNKDNFFNFQKEAGRPSPSFPLVASLKGHQTYTCIPKQ